MCWYFYFLAKNMSRRPLDLLVVFIFWQTNLDHKPIDVIDFLFVFTFYVCDLITRNKIIDNKKTNHVLFMIYRFLILYNKDNCWNLNNFKNVNAVMHRSYQNALCDHVKTACFFIVLFMHFNFCDVFCLCF